VDQRPLVCLPYLAWPNAKNGTQISQNSAETKRIIRTDDDVVILTGICSRWFIWHKYWPPIFGSQLGSEVMMLQSSALYSWWSVKTCQV